LLLPENRAFRDYSGKADFAGKAYKEGDMLSSMASSSDCLWQ